MVATSALPVAASALIGRVAEVAAIRAALLDGSARLVTLTGPPGVGKTRLALAVAADTQHAFADGQVWIDLAAISDPALVLPELARGLGTARPGSSMATLAAGLADRQLLIVVDNCEHVLPAAPVLGALVAQLPRCRVLATSRHRLELSAEHEFPVPPLPMPGDNDAGDLAVLAANPAVQLVLARAPSHITLTRRSAPAFVDICHRLDGLPLALELAAARLRVFTPGELAFRLEHRTADLRGGTRDAPLRHRSLSAAISWSHDLLPGAERAALRRLSVFAGAWTLGAAQAICGLTELGTLACVESLLDQSLVQRVPAQGPARFAMLASIREFAGRQLELSGEVTGVRDQHGSYFADLACAWEATVGTRDENASWDEFDAVRGDLAVAAERAPTTEARAWLATALAWHGYTRGALAQGDAVLLALHETTSAPDGIGGSAREAALTAAGVLAYGLGELGTADRDLRDAIGLCEASGNDRRRGTATAFRGHVARDLGRVADAAAHYHAARRMFVAIGNDRGVAWSAHDLGLLALDAAEPSRRAVAEPLLREALSYFDDLDYPWAAAQAARGLATALVDHGDLDEAAQLLRRSLLLHDEVRDRRGGAQCLEGLARIAQLRGVHRTAARLIGAAQAQRRISGTPYTEPEQRRAEDLESAIVTALGRVVADHEVHAGRTAARASVLESASGVVDPAPPTHVVTLTGRQAEVAELVAAGSTNRQIGRALGISEKTAEIHVRNIMHRLGVPSRAAVAAWAAVHAAQSPPQ